MISKSNWWWKRSNLIYEGKFLIIKFYVTFKSEFEDLAISVLEIFDNERTDKVDDVLIVRYFKDLKIDCLDLAIECKSENFVCTSIVQRALDKIWFGSESDKSIIVRYFLLNWGFF